ncbi:uncharacterized protein CCOS01_14529 [Colletotrichum costaricense]|uniref:Uncharacterized protein n=2 Tax=Colletotrichum acutatum species complex TaxID=2707335 RepID=A0AAI9YIL6_9PEZI|nr:uncharacterized protein CCOS01_14529 [Colletotrichum costaricense]XP_060382894.1 uncharacterized protein CTAM01_06608 [Colletotrichum tamarilloi]KAK1500673.1 hypothetical protein CTAM01_06608 [Colletotrichum tamarilloi]KAK1512289.1 hypothetical protein CCOS01_14529 [Colletotrichum costaricense]
MVKQNKTRKYPKLELDSWMLLDPMEATEIPHCHPFYPAITPGRSSHHSILLRSHFLFLLFTASLLLLLLSLRLRSTAQLDRLERWRINSTTYGYTVRILGEWIIAVVSLHCVALMAPWMFLLWFPVGIYLFSCLPSGETTLFFWAGLTSGPHLTRLTSPRITQSWGASPYPGPFWYVLFA